MNKNQKPIWTNFHGRSCDAAWCDFMIRTVSVTRLVSNIWQPVRYNSAWKAISETLSITKHRKQGQTPKWY